MGQKGHIMVQKGLKMHKIHDSEKIYEHHFFERTSSLQLLSKYHRSKCDLLNSNRLLNLIYVSLVGDNV